MVDPEIEEISGCRDFSEPLEIASKEVNGLNVTVRNEVSGS